MTHNIRIACLGAGEGLAHAVHALLEHAVVPAENIILSRKDGPKIERFTASGCTLLDDDMNAIMRGELVLVVAPGDELDAVLAPVCGCTSGRYLIAVSDRAKLSDIVNRVAWDRGGCCMSSTGRCPYHYVYAGLYGIYKATL